MADLPKPTRIINSRAPTRICDNGGWTDTWFARYGSVFSIAVSPVIEVQLRVFPRESHSTLYTIDAQNFNHRYSIAQPNGSYGKHPLIEAILDYRPAPPDQALELSIFSEAPAGCSTGTSAAVAVAVLGALDCLAPNRLDRYELAAAAHRVETELLHRQCGIQDQIASAFGGINFIAMDDYPRAKVHNIQLTEAMEHELEARLALIYVGRSHSSSHVHEMVIRDLQDAGPSAAPLERLRAAAVQARDALSAGDFAGLGRSMIENTEAQRDLHPKLIGGAHQEIIDIASHYGAMGWKVNGAGGEGGSLAILSGPNRAARRSMLQAIESANCDYRSIPVRLDRWGCSVWDSPLQ